MADTKHKEQQAVRQRTPGGRYGRGVLAVVVLWGFAVAAVQAQTGTQPSEAELAAGRRLYEERCAHCHGAEGDGQGPAAPVVYPTPRDFTSGVYKFRTRHESADGNRLPADEDIFRSIKEGLHGTSMPSWGGFFSDPQIWQLVHYIKTFADVFSEDKPGSALDFSGEVPFSAESVAKGKEHFENTFECHTCHGTAGRGNGPQALEGLDDDWGNRIWPANLTRPWTYRGGHNRRDIFRNIAMGINGTPMPAFADPDPMSYARQVVNREERKEEEALAREIRENIWHVVNYVQSLWTYPEEPNAQAVLTAKRVAGPLPLSPEDAAWHEIPVHYYPLVGQVTEGERLFTPMVVGIEVQAMHNGTEVAFRLVWDDRTESKPADGGDSETFADAAALQFPSRSSGGTEKPYFLMGDTSHPTDLWYWRNDTEATVLVQTTGYKTFQPGQPGQPGEQAGGIESQGLVDNGQYRVVMKRALRTAKADQEVQFTEGNFIPISLTVWDGSNGEHGGDKRTVMAWYNLYLEPEPSKTPIYLMLLGLAVGLVIEFSALYMTRKNQTT